MRSAALGLYVKTFQARCELTEHSSEALVDEPGILGLSFSDGDRRVRLLVTDDRARDHMSGLLGDARAGMVSVCAAAVRCAALLDDDPAWQASTATAMVCRDLQVVPALALPAELTLRPVRRLPDESPAGVPLTQAVAAATRADPDITDPQALADYLRSLPRAFQLWVAADEAGVIRATSGSAAFGVTATVLFVNTDPGWRRRGIARAMTALALRAAEQAGARHASLDAGDAGTTLYLRLGFDPVTLLRRYRPSV
jgi:GNAT superfamily N-acetyltransferase